MKTLQRFSLLIAAVTVVILVRIAHGPFFVNPIPKNKPVYQPTESNQRKHLSAALEESDLAPNTVNFAFLAKNDKTELAYYQYLAIKAAKVNGKADQIILHYDKYLPTGKLFEAAKKYLTECRQTPYDLASIYGNKVNVVEHKKDLLQMQTLRDHGGVFIDLDMIILRPFQELLKNDFSLVKEGFPDTFLCAFLQCKPHSFFLERWIEAYKNFNDRVYMYHCSNVPFQLQQQYPEHVTVLERWAAAMPWTTDDQHRMTFFDRTYDYKLNYATHLWHYLGGRSYSEALSTKLIWSLETSLFCKLRNLTADEPGAGVWDEEMSKDCEIITMEGSANRVKGLIGNWPLSKVKETMPKVRDMSGNRMHGILSPMNKYKAAGKEFSDDHFIFNRGDHIYLPMVPESKASSFTLTLKVKLTSGASKYRVKPTIISVLLGLDHQLNVHFHSNTVSLELAQNEGDKSTNRGDSVINIPELDEWYQLTLIGKYGMFSLTMAKGTVTLSDLPDEVKSASLAGIWLGRKNPPKIYRYTHETDLYDGSCIHSVKLFDYIVEENATG